MFCTSHTSFPFHKAVSFLTVLLMVSIYGCRPNQNTPDNSSSEDITDTEEMQTTPELTTPTFEGLEKSVYVYVENSGSMYGYVGAGEWSDFRNVVYNYLTDIDASRIFDKIHLNFINSETTHLSPSIEDFVKKLTPQSFQVSNGNSGATDIANIIKKIYPTDGSVAVLVSDCIVSPGKGYNAAEYLVNQQTGIKGFLAKQENIDNTGVIIYRMLGNFKGYYYDTVDSKKHLECKRPYYIWVMGDIETLKQMREVIEPKLKQTPDQICALSKDNNQFSYSILAGGGKYKLSRSNKNAIEKAGKVQTPTGNRFVVQIAADFSKMLQDDDFLTDASNYTLSDPSFRIDNIKKTDTKYLITISRDRIKKGVINVILRNKPPFWVDECSDDSGGFPDKNESPQKTFGLSYIIGGVYDAFTFNSDNLANMEITIK